MRTPPLGEFGMIRRFARLFGPARPALIGIGDDAAVLPFDKTRYQVLTTDMLIEGRHFRLDEATPRQIGRKAMAVNLSDVAAMAATPAFAVVSVGIPARLGSSFAVRMARGVADMAEEFGVRIVGGDTNASDRVVISVAVLGWVKKNRLVLRSGARPGDRLFVTGSLGGSYPSGKHLNFKPRLAEAHFLSSRFRIRAMMDLSDGLGSDLFRLCERSKVGAVINGGALPLSKHARNLSSAVNDGEDFELLFALSQTDSRRLVSLRVPRGLAGFTCIGEITKRSYGILMREPGRKPRPFREGGFNHFRVTR